MSRVPLWERNHQVDDLGEHCKCERQKGQMTMSEETKLQAKYEDLAGRVECKAAELEAVKVELSGLIARLIDASAKERLGLIARRAELVNLRDLLKDELQELTSRRDVSYLAIFEHREKAAHGEVERLLDIQRAARQKVREADTSLMRFRNSGRRALMTDDTQQELVRLEVEQAQSLAELEIATRNLTRAKDALHRAKAETDKARAGVGVTAGRL